MSTKYKFRDQNRLYFVSFAVVYWIDVFIRDEYREVILQSLRYCQQNKGLEIYAWCLMPSHMHMIIGTNDNNMQDIMRDFKSYTSHTLKEIISKHETESRKEWMLWMMERAGKQNINNNKWQFWQQDNHPIELFNNEMQDQKLSYIHENPMKAGFVDEASAWLYSSARDYEGKRGLLDILYIG